MMLRASLVALTVTGTSASSLVASPHVAKVVSMMQELQNKITEEGKEEQNTFRKFTVFCTDTEAEKAEVIQTNSDAKATLEANIATYEADKVKLNASIEEALVQIQATEAKIGADAVARQQEKDAYVKSLKETHDAIHSLDAAVESLKVTKDVSFIQKTVKALSSKLHSKELPSEDYNFHSGDIISTLEGLQSQFRATKSDAEEAESKAELSFIQAHQALKSTLESKKREVAAAREVQALRQKELAQAQQELVTTTAQLEDDKKFLNETLTLCAAKNATFNQRLSARSNEVLALGEAIEIMSGNATSGNTPKTMLFALAAAAESRSDEAPRAPKVSFLQQKKLPVADLPGTDVRQVPVRRLRAANSRQQALLETLRNRMSSLKDSRPFALLEKAAQADGPLDSIRELISNMITDFQKQAAASQEQKAYCDQRTSSAETKREEASKKVADLNAELAMDEAREAKLSEELHELNASKVALNEQQAKAVELRATEANQSQVSAAEAKEALETTRTAIQVLTQYYQSASESKEQVSLLKAAPKAPETGFKVGEAYGGSPDKATGVLGMLDVIASDFERTIKESQAQEAKAIKDHESLMAEIKSSLAEKDEATKQKTKMKTETAEELTQGQSDLASQTAALKLAVQELDALSKECGVGVTYEERKANREAEIEQLKEAIEEINNFMAVR
jgi:hypothetical protein